MWLQHTNKQKINCIYFNWLKINKHFIKIQFDWLIVEARQTTTRFISRLTDYVGR